MQVFGLYVSLNNEKEYSFSFIYELREKYISTNMLVFVIVQ